METIQPGFEELVRTEGAALAMRVIEAALHRGFNDEALIAVAATALVQVLEKHEGPRGAAASLRTMADELDRQLRTTAN